MTNLFQDIFGGSSSTSTSTPTNMNPFTSSLGGSVNTLGNSLAGGLPQYTGQLAAPMSGNEGSTLATLMQQTGQGGGVAGTNDYLANVLKGNMMPGSPGGNPFLQSAITGAQRTTMDNLTQTLSRSLPGYFTANGQMISPNNNGQGGSSAFDYAASNATKGAANAMGDIAANMSNNAFNTGVQQQQGAAQLSQAEIGNTVQNLQAQALPRMIQQLGITNGLQLYQTNLSGVLNLLNTLGGIAKPVVGQDSQSTGTQTPGILPDISQLLSAVKPSGGSSPGGGGGTAA